MKLFSNIISFVFHPLLMVTYGIVLALMFTFLAIYPLPVKLLIAGGTFISTAIVPGLFIFLLVKNGADGDIELSDRKERVVPYLIFITSILVCIFFLYKMLMPFSAFFGAFRFLLADTIGLTIAAPNEVSAAVIMSVVGGPFFILLLRRSGRYGK